MPDFKSLSEVLHNLCGFTFFIIIGYLLKLVETNKV